MSCTNGSVKRGRAVFTNSMDNGIIGSTAGKSPLLKCMKYSDGQGVFTCERCKRSYRRKSVFDEYIENCTEERNMGDTFKRAMGIAYDTVCKENSTVVYTKYGKNPKLSEENFNEATDCRKVKVGWTGKPKWGDALGGNTVQEFKGQIKEWFDIGSHDPGKKMSASRIRRILQAMHPNRYDMPTEQQKKSGRY